MSRIVFHSKHGNAEVSNSERALAAVRATDEFYDLIRVSSAACRAIRVRGAGEEMDRAQLTGAFMSGTTWTVGRKVFYPFVLVLNTALVKGPDTRRLAVRLHGQCELHAYVEGRNRAWLADLIEVGIEDGTFRREMVTLEGRYYKQGWDEVTTLLRSADDGPVVTSFTVSEGFPDVQVVKEFGSWSPRLPEGLDPDAYSDAWYDAWYEEPMAWEIAMDALRKQNERDHLELRPEGFADFRFGDGAHAGDLIDAAEAATV